MKTLAGPLSRSRQRLQFAFFESNVGEQTRSERRLPFPHTVNGKLTQQFTFRYVFPKRSISLTI